MRYALDLTTLHEQIEPILHKVAQVQRTLWRSRTLSVSFKDDGSYVCKADTLSEQLLKQELSKLFDQADFYAEESGISGNGPYHWVIDPLDGTTNYVCGLPYFGISLALTYKHSPVWGAVFNSLTDDFIYAAQGNGSFFNGRRLVCNDALLRVPVIVDAKEDLRSCIARALADHKVFFRNFGASSLDQVYIACVGRGAVICSQKRGWWDVAAGMLIITESGGLVTDMQGNSVNQGFTSYVAGSPLIHSTLLRSLKSCSS